MQSPRRSGLSKSKITLFEQCPKRLWLSTYRAEIAEPEAGSGARFAIGHEVGARACALLSDGVMVEAEPDLAAALSTTRSLLEHGHDEPIFEATLQYDGVLVRIDIMEPDDDGGWWMVEVKSSTKTQGYHAGDLATQLWVARQAGVPISSAVIRHINTNFVLEREGSYHGLFTDTDLTADVEPIVQLRGETIAAARETLAGEEPETLPGAHCKSPFACEFVKHCSAGLPTEPNWPVTILPNGGGKSWVEQGVYDLLKVDPSALTSPMHQRIHRATATGVVYHDQEGARTAMAGWAFPRTWLDFETIGFAIPRWVGTRPYQQVPFQFSAHVELVDGTLTHHEFLSLDGTDPQRACAEALVRAVPLAGTVIAYNAGFEKRCLSELAANLPDLANSLSDIAQRVVDLLPVTRATWYHRDQRGSWSIKAVLPTIIPKLGYAELAVANGAEAQAAYIEASQPDCTSSRRKAIGAALRLYCQRDTEAIIILADHLVTGTNRYSSQAPSRAGDRRRCRHCLGQPRS